MMLIHSNTTSLLNTRQLISGIGLATEGTGVALIAIMSTLFRPYFSGRILVGYSFMLLCLLIVFATWFWLAFTTGNGGAYFYSTVVPSLMMALIATMFGIIVML